MLIILGIINYYKNMNYIFSFHFLALVTRYRAALRSVEGRLSRGNLMLTYSTPHFPPEFEILSYKVSKNLYFHC